jgi:hypothetical protein
MGMDQLEQCGFFEPTKTQSPFAMCQNAQSKKKGHGELELTIQW